MAWVMDTINNATEQRMIPTMNGPALFADGAFFVAYNASGYSVANTASEYSILNGQNANSNANFTANTTWVSPITNPTVMTTLNLSGDPSGVEPRGTLLLPGTGLAQSQIVGMGALSLATIFNVDIQGSINTTGTGTFQTRCLLRNATTGAVAYVLCDTTAFTAVATGSALGLLINHQFQVVSGGSSGTIVGFSNVTYGHANGSNGGTYMSAPVSTTVDCTKSYILDVTVKFGTAASNNTVGVYSAYIGIAV